MLGTSGPDFSRYGNLSTRVRRCLGPCAWSFTITGSGLYVRFWSSHQVACRHVTEQRLRPTTLGPKMCFSTTRRGRNTTNLSRCSWSTSGGACGGGLRQRMSCSVSPRLFPSTRALCSGPLGATGHPECTSASHDCPRAGRRACGATTRRGDCRAAAESVPAHAVLPPSEQLLASAQRSSPPSRLRIVACGQRRSVTGLRSPCREPRSRTGVTSRPVVRASSWFRVYPSTRAAVQPRWVRVAWINSR